MYFYNNTDAILTRRPHWQCFRSPASLVFHQIPFSGQPEQIFKSFKTYKHTCRNATHRSLLLYVLVESHAGPDTKSITRFRKRITQTYSKTRALHKCNWREVNSVCNISNGPDARHICLRIFVHLHVQVNLWVTKTLIKSYIIEIQTYINNIRKWSLTLIAPIWSNSTPTFSSPIFLVEGFLPSHVTATRPTINNQSGKLYRLTEFSHYKQKKVKRIWTSFIKITVA